MSDPSDLLEATLKEHGKSLTAPRRTVFEALQASEPLTMAELVAKCPSIDRVSTYRTIELFEKLHIIQRLQVGWKYKLELSNRFIPHHHHASCENCGRILEFPEDKKIESRLVALAKSVGFDMHDHILEIRGVCQNCQNSNSGSHK